MSQHPLPSPADVSHRGRFSDELAPLPATGRDTYLPLAQSAQAELVNLRRRLEHDRRQARQRALCELLSALAPAIEQTELALRAAKADGRDLQADPLLHGVLAAQRELLATLARLHQDG